MAHLRPGSLRHRLGSLRHAFRLLPRRQILALILGAMAVLLLAAGIRFSHRVTALRELRATGPNWSFPSRVYSVVVPGVNAGAINAFLEAGLRTESFGAWMSAKPVGMFDGYLLAGGMLL